MMATQRADRLYELLPAGLPRAGRRRTATRCAALLRIVGEPGRPGRAGRRAALERPLHRDLPPLGDPVHRRPRLQQPPLRRAAVARRRTPTTLFTDLRRPRPAAAGRDPHARRRREDDLLPPPQGHAADARGARARRHRLARARRRVLRAARLDAAPRALPARRRAGSTSARSSATSASTAPFDEASHTVDVRADLHRRRLALDQERRLLPLAARHLPRCSTCRPARPATPWRFHFSPLGNPAPLFTHPRREGDEARPVDRAARARRRSAARSSGRPLARTEDRRRPTSPTSTAAERSRARGAARRCPTTRACS